MYGSRARIGVILPSNNAVLEPELYRMLPPGETSAHFTRLFVRAPDAAGLHEMARRTGEAVAELAAADVDVLLYACLSTSLVEDTWESEFAARVAAVTGRPCETAAGATVAGLRAVGASRICLVTPYPASLNRQLAGFLGRHGIEVACTAALDVADMLDVGRREPGEVYDLARQAWDGAADALCVVATDLRTIDVIDALERDLGTVVVTTNQALVWAALRRAGLDDSIEGFGALLREAA